MKRTAWRRKTPLRKSSTSLTNHSSSGVRKGLKRKSPLRKKSKSAQRALEDELWVECKRIADEQYGTDCFTCPAKNLQGRNKQLGHVPWPKASLGAFLKYDIRLLRNQCFRCNINLGGNGAVAYAKMLRQEGKLYMDKLEQDRNVTVKSFDFYTGLLREYKEMKK